MIFRLNKLIFLLTVLIYSCTNAKNTNDSTVTTSSSNDEYKFPVIAMKASKGILSDYISLNGDVDTKMKAEIFPDIAGKLTSLDVKLGTYVAKGQIIAALDPSRPGSVYLKSPIRAPISGYILSVKVKVGQTITTQTGIAVVGRIDTKQITTYASEKYVSEIKVGNDAVLELDAYPNEKFFSKVSEVSPVVDSKSRTIEVYLTPSGKNVGNLIVGMFAKIKLITKSRNNVIKIPSSAVVEREGKLFIFKINKEGDTVSMIPLSKDFEIDNIIAIKDGVEDGDLIVIEGMSSLADGVKVHMVDTREGLDSKNNV